MTTLPKTSSKFPKDRLNPKRKGIKDLLPTIDFQRGYSKQVWVPDRVPVHVSLDPPKVTPTHTPNPYDWRMANGRPVRFNFCGCWLPIYFVHKSWVNCTWHCNAIYWDSIELRVYLCFIPTRWFFTPWFVEGFGQNAQICNLKEWSRKCIIPKKGSLKTPVVSRVDSLHWYRGEISTHWNTILLIFV